MNNWTDEEYEIIVSLPYRFLVIGSEVGETGTPHIQGYIEFKGVHRLSAMKKMIPRAHFEIRFGTREEAKQYCMKDGEYAEFGDWEAGGQGSRNDLFGSARMAAEEGMRTVTAAYTNPQAHRAAENYLTYNEEPRDWAPLVEWIWGPTGVGKSRTARERCCNEDVYVKSESSKWWPGYDGHEVIIIDDFRDSWWCLTDTLSLLDRYERRIEFKGGFRQFKPKKIIVTSIFPPEHCYTGTGECVKQLLRRINTVTEICNKDEGNTIASSSSVPLTLHDSIEILKCI